MKNAGKMLRREEIEYPANATAVSYLIFPKAFMDRMRANAFNSFSNFTAYGRESSVSPTAGSAL